MEQNQQPQQQWQGLERRQSLGQYQGEDRRKPQPGAQPTGTPDDGSPIDHTDTH